MSQRLLAYIGLGANLDPAQASLERAVAALASVPGARLVGVSRLYLTRPVGDVEQPDFHNAVVGLEVPRGATPEEGAMALLISLKALEATLGRRAGPRWGPRAIDLDLLLFGAHRVRAERAAGARSTDAARGGPGWLEVPHPEAQQRLFVLAPLAELAPDLVPPGWGMSVAEARDAARSREGPGAVHVAGEWDPERRRWITPGASIGGA